jgi:hypothetical protein
VLKKAESDLQPFLDEGVIDRGELDQAFGLPLFESQRFLSMFELSDRDGFGEVGVDQLAALPIDSLQAAALGCQ